MITIMRSIILKPEAICIEEMACNVTTCWYAPPMMYLCWYLHVLTYCLFFLGVHVNKCSIHGTSSRIKMQAQRIGQNTSVSTVMKLHLNIGEKKKLPWVPITSSFRMNSSTAPSASLLSLSCFNSPFLWWRTQPWEVTWNQTMCIGNPQRWTARRTTLNMGRSKNESINNSVWYLYL